MHVAEVHICLNSRAFYAVGLEERRREPVKVPDLLWAVQIVHLVSQSGDPIHPSVSCKSGDVMQLAEEANYNGENWICIENQESTKYK